MWPLTGVRAPQTVSSLKGSRPKNKKKETEGKANPGPKTPKPPVALKIFSVLPANVRLPKAETLPALASYPRRAISPAV